MLPCFYFLFLFFFLLDHFLDVVVDLFTYAFFGVFTILHARHRIVVDSKTGLLIPLNNALNFADAIVRMSKDSLLRYRFGCDGRQHIQKNFSLEKMIQQYEDLYFSLL